MMNTEESKTVKEGDILHLHDVSTTPGRIFYPAEAKGNNMINRILVEPSGYVHFDIGMTLTAQDAPLKSRDTGEELDGSNTYWMHPSRFEKI